MSKAHPGFAKVQAKIAAKEGVSSERAGAILAASTRRAGPAARKANPRLNRVKRPHNPSPPYPQAGCFNAVPYHGAHMGTHKKI